MWKYLKINNKFYVNIKQTLIRLEKIINYNLHE